MDETHKVAVTRLGDRIRVGGMAELAGYNLKLHEARRAHARACRHRSLPRRRRRRRAPSFWCGLRPMTPDGTPVIGATPIAQPLPQHRPRHARLDHGRGTGRVMADLISGRSAGIDLAGLTIARYGGAVASR